MTGDDDKKKLKKLSSRQKSDPLSRSRSSSGHWSLPGLLLLLLLPLNGGHPASGSSFDTF
jgi:hypothetical protein